MARPRKSADVHRLQGTYQPCRHESKPASQVKPICPREFDDTQRRAFRDLVRAGGGRLTAEDMATLEPAARLLARIRKDGDDISAAMVSQYRGYLRDLQLTKSTRPPAPEAPDDSWEF